ncbi:MAG: PEGA domain-containing protein, partial [Myxococcota bacterium]
MRGRFTVVVVASLSAASARAQPQPSSPATTAPPPADVPPAAPALSEYERHMRNGVTLFRDENWDGAIAEFEAAYRAEPKGSPLINLALTHKRLNNPAKAIEVLKTSLRKHRDTMPPDQIAAAEREIQEMTALLAYLSIEVEPKNARVTVDDRPLSAEKRQRPVALSPGTRVIRVEQAGFRSLERRVRIASGRSNKPLRIKLEPMVGRLKVVAEAPDWTIEVDGKDVAQGRWEGTLAPGIHVVRVIRDTEFDRLDIAVAAGADHVVEQKNGQLESEAALPEDEQEKVDFGLKQIRSLRGLYFYGFGSFFAASILAEERDQPQFEPDNETRFGGGGAISVGYRVARWAGFEFLAQYSDIRTTGSVDNFDPTPRGCADTGTIMVLESARFGGLMRVMYPGDNKLRLIGRVGGG